MISARTAWKYRKLAWKYRGLLKYYGLGIPREAVLAGVITGLAVTCALARHCLLVDDRPTGPNAPEPTRWRC